MFKYTPESHIPIADRLSILSEVFSQLLRQIKTLIQVFSGGFEDGIGKGIGNILLDVLWVRIDSDIYIYS